MSQRTKTYVAADWDHDFDIVEQLFKWNESDYWQLSFENAHDLTSARDGSLPCSIKKSLKRRLDESHTFVLVVGNHTNSIRKGGCHLCKNYTNFNCTKGYSVDHDSFVKYESRKAVDANLRIIVLYKSTAKNLDKNKCISVLQGIGTHIAIYTGEEKKLNYLEVKNAMK